MKSSKFQEKLQAVADKNLLTQQVNSHTETSQDLTTDEDSPGDDLQQLIKSMKRERSQFEGFTLPYPEGYYDGISKCIKITERRLKKIIKIKKITKQLKPHTK